MDKLNKKGLNAMHEAISGVCFVAVHRCMRVATIRVLLSTAPMHTVLILLTLQRS